MSDAGLLAAANAIRADAAGRDPWLLGLPIAGIGWATVELERAAEELDAAFHRAGMPQPSWTPAKPDGLLGAAAWVSREWWPTWDTEEPPAIVLLEPDTEGRLAAALARSGEGVAAIYLAPREAGLLTADRARVGTAAAGPLGTGRLVLARPTWGPHVVVLDRPVLPARP
ncbi:MAG TPA: hypothetical protein VHR16_10150 [Candidatus Limnocylindrales bacterium]|nr:hypothetical protein [Candidatus Limnocylindrales bacterium]